MNTDIQIALSRALQAQPWYVRRKDTITAVAGTILQLANVAAMYATDGPEWVSVLIAAVIGLCQMFVHAGTKGAFTDSMKERLAEYAPEYTEYTDPFEVGALAAEKAGQAVPNPYDLDGSTVYGQVTSREG